MGDAMVPNHHAHHPRFAGVGGLVAALTMLVGRRGDAQLAVELAELRAGDDVVDIGCGPGVAARYAARLGASVVGVDPAAVMLRVARLAGRASGVAYRDGAAEHVPVDAGAASVVWSLATVHHWADVDAGISEVARVLRPGGRFVAIERRSHAGARGLASHGWTDGQAEAFARACGAHGLAAARVVRRTTQRGPKLAVVAVKA
jgi:ubiquinone/menaquinone biosynthesis C-methylase UbiE